MDNSEDIQKTDQKHIWHPYSGMNSDILIHPVKSASGVRLTLTDGRELIDGMSSWWCVIHGYNHPVINKALEQQIHKMSHVMFGGLTHEPATELTRQLVEITPDPLQTVFFSDSGSVSVEVALKMAIQYWHAKGQSQRQHFISLRSGYHGDTIGAMSVSDPDTGMHTIFNDALPKNYFADQPKSRFGDPCNDNDTASLAQLLKEHSNNTAAVILEPIVQGAGGMWFYSAGYLKKVRELCDRYGVLLILDEIATGFGRTGKLFACEHAEVSPDIMCVGKALTGGYLTLAATLTTTNISDTISKSDPGLFMHGPTFMANPLACTAASASIRLLLESPWQKNVQRIQQNLEKGLAPCSDLAFVKDVRVLGAIGVVELQQPVDMKSITQKFVDAGVWIRPFGRLVYLMPPFIISDEDLAKLTSTIVSVLSDLKT
jgi:adenosylmethionine-8-amino-7-oxononanoate aminotransferase